MPGAHTPAPPPNREAGPRVFKALKQTTRWLFLQDPTGCYPPAASRTTTSVSTTNPKISAYSP